MDYKRKTVEGVDYYQPHHKFFQKNGNTTPGHLVAVLAVVLLLGLAVWAMQSHIIVIK